MTPMNEAAIQWSLRTWRERHEHGYFPRSQEHWNWKVYDTVPDWLLARVDSRDIALEVGCGYGEWMIPLAPHVGSIMGVDIHQAPVEKGRDLVAQRRITNVKFRLSDGVTLPSNDRAFSLVYSISVFQHLPRVIVGGYLRETRRVLDRGGRCLHHFRNADNVGPYPRLASDITVNHTGDFSVGWTKKEVEDAARDAGLKVADVVDMELFLLLVAHV